MGEMKVYVMPNGAKRQYREGEQPACAVEVKAEKPKAKGKGKKE